MSESESSSPPPKKPKIRTSSLPLWVVALVAVVVMTAGVALAWLLSGGVDSLANATASGRTENPTPEVTPVSTPAPTEVPVAKALPAEAPEIPKATAAFPPTTLGPPTAPAVPAETPAVPILTETVTAVDFNPEAVGNSDVRAEVLKRIDLMPTIKPEVKDKLYAQVDRSRAMGMLIRIPFASGKTTISAKDLENLKAATQKPSVQKLVSDPTAVFVILGYADTQGSASGNYQVSLSRAESVLETLRDKCGLQNVMHSVAMGGSDFFDSKQADKNRLAEVWAVLP